MDSIAAQGVYFTRSYCPYPLCSPSRSSLHTGRTPHEIGVDRNSVPIDPAVPISGQVFRAAGYDTGYAGKWHMPEPYPADGIAGFEVLNKTSRQGKLAHDVDEATMNAAIEFLKRKRDKPFLLVVSFINPHDICLLAGEDSPLLDEVWKKYEPAAGAELPPLPANFGLTAGRPDNLAAALEHEDWDETALATVSLCLLPHGRGRGPAGRAGAGGAAPSRPGGEHAGRLHQRSRRRPGLAPWTGKMMFYEEEAAVPLIVSWKGVTPAGRIDREHLVSTLDVLPTICDYAGVAGPAVMRGESLRDVIEKPELPGHEFVASEMAGGGAGGSGRSFMVRTKQVQVHGLPRRRASRDAVRPGADPGEMKNLAGEPALAGELERHRQLLAQWKQDDGRSKHPVQPSPKAAKPKAGRKQQPGGKARRGLSATESATKQ